MTQTLYLISVFLHIVSALVWLGGMLFLAVVAVPALRQLDAPTRSRLMADVGRRFRIVGWVAIAALLVTGVGNALGRWGWPALSSVAFWRTGPGQLLAWKLLVVGLMWLLSALHDFWLGPRLTALGRQNLADPAIARLRRGTVWLARMEMVMGLTVVALAIRLVRGG